MHTNQDFISSGRGLWDLPQLKDVWRAVAFHDNCLHVYVLMLVDLHHRPNRLFNAIVQDHIHVTSAIFHSLPYRQAPAAS